MFAMGKELKNDLFLYSYDIMNESTVQVMIIKNWETPSEMDKRNKNFFPDVMLINLKGNNNKKQF